MLTLKQFQRIAQIEANDDLTEYYKIVSIAAVARKMKFEDAEKIPFEECKKIYAALPISIKELNDVRYDPFIRIGRDWYRMETNFNKLSAGQLIELLNYEMSNDDEIVKEMHNILATLSRRCRFYKWFPEKYNADQHQKRAKKFLNVDVKTVFGYTGFFLIFLEILLENLRSVLAEEMTSITDKD